MKILVAGGAGYIGSALVPVLLDHGYEITVIDLLWFGNHLPKETNVIQKDLFTCTEEDFAGFDQVIYLAGLSNDPMAEFDPVRNFIYNASLPAYLAYIAKRAGVKRYIYASTCSVYGYTTDQLFDESAKISCNYPYGVSKLQGEKGVMHLQDDTFSAICFRKGTVSGYSPRMRFDLIINTMTVNAMTKGVITVSNPSIWRPIIAMHDVISAYLRAIQVNYSISGVFNIAYDNYTVGEAAYIVKDIIEKAHLNKHVRLDVKDIQDFRNYKVTVEKARTTLGFHPRYSVADIVTELLNKWDILSPLIDNDGSYNIRVCKKLFTNKEIKIA
jgi:nucleoside-diphosphate-sugar epimerase